MAPAQLTIKSYFNERKSASDTRRTRSQKLSDQDIIQDDRKDPKAENKVTSVKSLSMTKSQKITDKKCNNVGNFEEELTPVVLDEDNIDDMLGVLPPTTPSKRRNKNTKEPCSPPKIKCMESMNVSSDLTTSKTASTPSTLIKNLTLSSPSSEAKASLPPKALFPEPEDILGKARNALHTHAKTSLPGREKELNQLNLFIKNHLDNETSGSLYISGPPGTGKTACLTKLLEEPEFKEHFKVVNINCTSIESPKAIYSRIAAQLKIQVKTKSGKAYLEAIEKHFHSNHKMILMVLDEMDQLDTRSRSVLYTIFEWPMSHPKGIILIGIANALDLTDRLLPRLKAKLQLAPELLHFAPYTREQLLNIFSKRLEEADASSIFRPGALQLLASKLSAVNGDARRALDTARRTVENESQKFFDAKMNAANSQTRLEGLMHMTEEPNLIRKSPRKALTVVPYQQETGKHCDKTKSPLLSPSKSFRSPLRSPLKSPFKSPLKSPCKSPLKSPIKSPLRSVTKSMVKSPLKSPAGQLHKENCSPIKPRSAKKSLVFSEIENSRKTSDVNLTTATLTSSLKEPCIDVMSVMNAVNDVYGTSQGLGRTEDGGEELPLHQKLAVCSLLLILREGKSKSKDVTVGKLHDVYRRVCNKRHMDPVDSGSFLSLLGLIEARGILLLPGRGKRGRLTKVCMQWIEEEVVSALKDRDLLAAIVTDRSCLS